MAEIAPQFPDLEILELIGAGGMGAVYKARQPKLDRLVALKILSHDLADDPAFEERFNREARVLARLNHPNIVQVFDFGTRGPFGYLLMEYVDGVNLRQAMHAGGFTPAESLDLVQDVCSALKFAHEEGILHRDIKPENILIDLRGRVKIADFGIAKLVGENGRDDFTLTMAGTALGSPHYMAPEQIESPGDVDQRADIYSLGVVLYELLTRELPLGRFGPPSAKLPMDSRIDEIVMRTLEKERQARYQTVAELQTRVVAITKSGVSAGSSVSPAAPSGAPASAETARYATASVLLAGLSVLLAGLAVNSHCVLKQLAQEAIHVGSSPGIVAGVFPVLWAISLLVVGVPAFLGIFLGSKALSEIRHSAGRKGGFRRAMLGVLTWPVLLILALTGALVWIPLKSAGSELATSLYLMVVFASGGSAAGFLLVRPVWRWVKRVKEENP